VGRHRRVPRRGWGVVPARSWVISSRSARSTEWSSEKQTHVTICTSCSGQDAPRAPEIFQPGHGPALGEVTVYHKDGVAERAVYLLSMGRCLIGECGGAEEGHIRGVLPLGLGPGHPAAAWASHLTFVTFFSLPS
jgi:hypothetical protein